MNQLVSDQMGDGLKVSSSFDSSRSTSIHRKPSGLIHTGLYCRGIHTASFSGTERPRSFHRFCHSVSERRCGSRKDIS